MDMKNTGADQRDALLRAKAEKHLGGAPAASPALPAEELLHELQVHQIELEMQNEDLRRAQNALEESRDRYTDLYEFAPVAYLTLSPEAMIDEINLTGTALLGEERKRLIHRRFALFVIHEDRDRWHQHFLRVLLHGDKQRSEVMLQRNDGTRFHAQMDYLRLEKEGGVPIVRIALTDISERKRAEEALRIAAIAFESQEGMMVTNAQGVIVQVNQAFTRLTGYNAEEAVGRTPALLKSGRQDLAFYQRLWAALKGKGYWQGMMWNRRKNGKIYADWLTISAVKAPDGSHTHYVCTYSGVTQNPEAEAELHRLAYYDPLTQLPNRRLLYDRLGQALASSARSGRYGAVLFLDLDRFKALNDTRGHDVGDQLLIDVAHRLEARVREGDTISKLGDTVSRLGGDEFVLMLEDLSTEAGTAARQARVVGEKVRDALDQPYTLEGQAFHCSASIGIALFHGHGETVKSLLKQADLALYQAKHAGRNTLRFFDPAMQAELDERSALEIELRQALKRGQLHLYYQPQFDSTRRIIGAEALLRWEHPERGLLAPDAFIPLAEESGIILPIDHWVLATACAQIKAWSAQPATRDLRLAVNISARQFRQENFVEEIKQLLAQTGADPMHLKIELTESVAIETLQDTIAKMQILKALGVGFSIDHFGTGYSSLSYLGQLPVEQLKIAQPFIHGLDADASSAAIAHTIINIGKTLNRDVIAEGVETEEQFAFLDHHGCHAFQGNLLSQPLPLDEFERLAESKLQTTL